MNGLQRLPQNEETAILDLARESGLEVFKLKCDYTRQKDSGSGVSKRTGREFDISYDLMLCKWCGNLEGSRNNILYCPHKLNVLKDRLLAA